MLQDPRLRRDRVRVPRRDSYEKRPVLSATIHPDIKVLFLQSILFLDPPEFLPPNGKGNISPPERLRRQLVFFLGAFSLTLLLRPGNR